MTAPKENPEGLAIRAKPRPVTRLSRKALALLLGCTAVAVFGGALWALRPAPKAKAPEELYSTDRKPTAEGLNSLPKTYGDATGGQAGVPRLGPPLPGDLGRPILNAQAAGRIPEGAAPQMGSGTAGETAASQARAEQLKAAQEARGSGLFSIAAANRNGGAGESTATDNAALTQAIATQASAVSASATPNAPAPSRHEAFANAAGDGITVSSHRLEALASAYSVLAGTVISAALVTGLDSDLPGLVIATVTAPVYDSVTGRTLLIPQGARLLGTYDSQVNFGESRAIVVWTRLIMPNGRSIILDRMQGTDAAGYAGLTDTVDNHWGQLVEGAVVSSLLGVGAELASPETQTTGNNGQIIIATRNGVQDTVNQVGQQLTKRNLDIKPTIRVRPGFLLRVLVGRDLVLEPYSGSD